VGNPRDGKKVGGVGCFLDIGRVQKKNKQHEEYRKKHFGTTLGGGKERKKIWGGINKERINLERL